MADPGKLWQRPERRLKYAPSPNIHASTEGEKGGGGVYVIGGEIQSLGHDANGIGKALVESKSKQGGEADSPRGDQARESLAGGP
jgi:hypothetical protein